MRDIGLSNFNSQQITQILDIARIKPSNLQVSSIMIRSIYVTFWKLNTPGTISPDGILVVSSDIHDAITGVILFTDLPPRWHSLQL